MQRTGAKHYNYSGDIASKHVHQTYPLIPNSRLYWYMLFLASPASRERIRARKYRTSARHILRKAPASLLHDVPGVNS